MVRAMVRLVKTKNCFINLPPHVARGVAGPSEGAVILKLLWTARPASSPSWAFASWNGGLSGDQSGAIEIPLALAQVVGLAEALDSDPFLSVQAEPAGYVPTASRVCLEPLSCDDWEIMEANADHLEGQMLTQVCVACAGQVMPIWVHGVSLIALRVVSTETPTGAAVACVRLTADTEVAVSPKPRHRRRLRQADGRHWRFRSSGLLRVAPPPPGWSKDRASRCGSGGRAYLLAHPATLAGIDGWNNSPRSRAPWPGHSSGEHGSSLSSRRSPAPVEALAVLWRDGPSSNLDGVGAVAGSAGGEGIGGAGSLDSGGGTAVSRSSGGGGGSMARGAMTGVGDGSPGVDGTSVSGGTQVVVILREDARVPPGHVADSRREEFTTWGGGATPCERVGLTLLRREARVRVLSTSETAVARPRLVLRRIIPGNRHSKPSGPSVAAYGRTVGDNSVSTTGSVSAFFQDAFRQSLSNALRGEEIRIAAASISCTLPEGGGDACGQRVRAGMNGSTSRNSGSEATANGGRPSQQSLLPQTALDSRSGPGLRQLALASSLSPLLLDEGAVISLEPLLPSTSLSAPSQDGLHEHIDSTFATRPTSQSHFSATGTLMDHFLVGFCSEKTPGNPDISPPIQEEASQQRATGKAAALAYALLSCQEDVDQVVADARIGPDVFARDLQGGMEKQEEGEGLSVGVLGGVEEQMRAASNTLAPVLVRSVAAARLRLGVAAAKGGLVVHGASGAGKTTLALAIARRLRESHMSMAGTFMISCRDLQGRKMADVLGAFEEGFSSASLTFLRLLFPPSIYLALFARAPARGSRHAPSLLILDDLDKVAPVEGEDGAGAFNAQSARIAERLEDLLAEVAGEAMAVGVIATAASVGALHPRLTRSGLLDAQVEIPPPRSASRNLILRSLVRELGASAPNSPVTGHRENQARTAVNHGEIYGGMDEREGDQDDDGIDWEYLSSKTEGCQARDLAKLVKRALLHAALRRMKNAESEVATAATSVFSSPPRHRQEGRQRFETPPSSAEVAAGLRGRNSGDSEGTGLEEEPTKRSYSGASFSDNFGTVSSDAGEGLSAMDAEDSAASVGREELGGETLREGNGCSIHMEDLEAALNGFSAESLRGAGLFRSSVQWGDVGGLRGVRGELREILELPVKYGRLFEATPTRLPTGALLYGPPGCGKTLLAGAVAAECGLNFISVKGPEVLDKYIGASEQAVRSLFARAASAAPCVLFFDEFEAVAPRRGNDNTGVTDRVVNQLLTFLDGVEGRDGVYVLGATSRPDLIDSALLRPGRLDRQLYCGFPDEAEREDILRAVCRKMSMTEEAREVALAKVAKSPKAQAFTGADLQAIVDTAQLSAIHSYLKTVQSPDTTSTTSVKGVGDDVGSGGQVRMVAKTPNGKVDASLALHQGVPSVDASLPRDRGKGDRIRAVNGTANGLVHHHNNMDHDTTVDRDADHSPSRKSGGVEDKSGVEVSADDIWKAFLSTRPSLSREDRVRYHSAYQKFRGGSRPADFHPISSVDDGTLRTALK